MPRLSPVVFPGGDGEEIKEIMLVFIRGKMTISFYNYGDSKTKEIPIHGIFEITEQEIMALDDFFIAKFGSFKYGTYDYTPNDKVSYKIRYKSISKIS